MVLNVIIIVAILYFGGLFGAAYLVLGLCLAVEDWYLWHRPLIEAADPQLRAMLPDVLLTDNDDWCDDYHALLMSVWRANLRSVQVSVVYLWFIPVFWLIIPRCVLAIIGGVRFQQELQGAVTRQIRSLLRDKDVLDYVEEETRRKWLAALESAHKREC